MSKVDFINTVKQAQENARTNPTATNIKLYGALSAIADIKLAYHTNRLFYQQVQNERIIANLDGSSVTPAQLKSQVNNYLIKTV